MGANIQSNKMIKAYFKRDDQRLLVAIFTLDELFYESESILNHLAKQCNVKLEYDECREDQVVMDTIEKMITRSAEGIQKYNTTLEDSPEPFVNWLQHAQEEAIDFALYLQKIKKIQNDSS